MRGRARVDFLRGEQLIGKSLVLEGLGAQSDCSGAEQCPLLRSPAGVMGGKRLRHGDGALQVLRAHAAKCMLGDALATQG